MRMMVVGIHFKSTPHVEQQRLTLAKPASRACSRHRLVRCPGLIAPAPVAHRGEPVVGR